MLDRFYEWSYNVLSDTNNMISKVFGLDWPLTVKFDFEEGPTWATMKPVQRTFI